MAAAPTMRAVLMGDPTHFSVRGGANPHTRNFLGMRRRVSRSRAVAQWHALARALIRLGVRVFVIPPQPACPGLVYPANAGFTPTLVEEPPERRLYVVSNLIASRAAEGPIYQAQLSGLGFETIRARHRFEGEADFFPAGDAYLLTTGRIERQRFVPHIGLPPWRRIYGFRTEADAEEELTPLVAPRPVFLLELVDESYYHGDTVLCSFGERRHHLLAYLEGLSPASQAILEAHFGDQILRLARADAEVYAANSFGLASGGSHYLVMPAGVGDALLDAVAARGVAPVVVEVSEFLKKGGGSVKCMIGDLGEMDDDESELLPEVVQFRKACDYRTLFPLEG
jgi:N-dimethylarginine dimethylaminohydrolase